MSRVIVKNLPKKATEAMVREAFEAVSQVTDVKLLYHSETGQFKGVAFVGMREEDAGDRAVKYFRKAYIGTCRVTVEPARLCRESPAPSRPKPVPSNPKWAEFQSLIHSDQPDAAFSESLDSTRLFLRNLPYTVTREEVETVFQPFGPIEEVSVPMDSTTSRPKGFAYVKFTTTEAAVEALNQLDGSVFQGRLLHVLPAMKKPEVEVKSYGKSSYKSQQMENLKEKARDDSSWNTLFLNQDAVAAVISQKLHITKGDFLDKDQANTAVRLSQAEAQVLEETKAWMQAEGINVAAFQQNKLTCPRSKRVLLIKNLSSKATVSGLKELFGRYGSVGRLCLAPSHTVALVEYVTEEHAKNAFERLAYCNYLHLPLYLEFAPIHTFEEEGEEAKDTPPEDSQTVSTAPSNSTIFVKNLSFETTSDALRTHFSQAGPVKSARIVTNAGLPCGYGFVEFASSAVAEKAVANMSNQLLDGHALKVSLSSKGEKKGKRTVEEREEEGNPGTKILIKNLPFEGTKAELRELFQTYGQVKTVRIPKKYSGGHRGFAFIDFVSQEEAQTAFSSLQGAHLYGRKLTLQWALQDPAPL